MFLYLIADVPRHFQTAVWGLSSKGFRRHIKANSVSSKLVVKSAYNPLKTPVNQGVSEIIIEFIENKDMTIPPGYRRVLKKGEFNTPSVIQFLKKENGGFISTAVLRCYTDSCFPF